MDLVPRSAGFGASGGGLAAIGSRTTRRRQRVVAPKKESRFGAPGENSIFRMIHVLLVQRSDMSNEHQYELPQPGEGIISGTDYESHCRINYLVTHYMTLVCENRFDVQTLYEDPKGLLWLREFPDFEQHGGGRPVLRMVTQDEARKIFGDEML
jgi:hypothetical protein